jgi:predicted 3-demethylubiquinone-9 3-methyltransferase (glyoxalase superfamily)
MPKVTPFLWFDNQALEAASFYVSIFPNSKITQVDNKNDALPPETGAVMTVGVDPDGQAVTFLNGGPHFKFTEAFSFVIDCENQAEVDYYWDRLLDGGQPGQCGWLKDRYGLSWQVAPKALIQLMNDPDRAKAARVGAAMMQMVKLDVAALVAAANG